MLTTLTPTECDDWLPEAAVGAGGSPDTAKLKWIRGGKRERDTDR